MGFWKLFRFLVFSLIIVGLVYIVGIIYILSHEAGHKQTFARYGIPSEISINKWGGGVTTPLSTKPCNDYCKTQHAMNDAIGYPMATFIFNTWALFIAWFAYKILYKNETSFNDKK